MEKVTRTKYVVELEDWYNLDSFFILVLERPAHCIDLRRFRNNSQLPEFRVKQIMWQVVQAARHCCDLGVLHSDIKSENILINPKTFEVKLIDFGCGELLTDKEYTRYAGQFRIDMGYNQINNPFFGMWLMIVDISFGFTQELPISGLLSG